jgi:hypothetical protein
MSRSNNDDDDAVKASQTADTVTDESDESSPLLKMKTRRRQHGGEDANDGGGQGSAKSAWRDLSSRVETGEFLLLGKAAAGDPSKHSSRARHEDKREATIRDIRSYLEFSLSQCLAAVLLYIALAVVVYHFLFENMTVIDAM